ncbi:Gfo/Idh/MocA family oxidoreductase [Trueperella sp. LYQ141]|uniref:Gfo/Idh/MocA family protein n=1 Tax=Trueperella sp. LYQ141 TaxID=3391058 RepID=UPI0039836EC3
MGYRIALMGAGRIGSMHGFLLRAMQSRVESIVVCDTNTEKAELLAAQLDADVASSEQVYASGNPLGIDALVLATPTSEHAAGLIAAAQAGLPTFCEKPLAMDIESAQAACQAVEAAQLPHHIGFQRRFDVGYRRARQAVRDGALGEVHRFHMLTADQFPPDDAFIPTSGGIFRDCNIHDFDIIAWVTGQPVVEVYATGVTRGREVFAAYNDPSEAAAILTLADGTIGTVHASRYNGQGYDVRLDLAGTRGSVNVGYDARVPLVVMDDGVEFPPHAPWTDFIERFQPCYERELSAFLDMLDTHGPSPCTARDALAALYVAVACDLSRREHRPVRLEEIR